MIRGILGLALIGTGGLTLYLQGFLGGLPWWIVGASVCGVLLGFWLVGGRKIKE